MFAIEKGLGSKMEISALATKYIFKPVHSSVVKTTSHTTAQVAQTSASNRASGDGSADTVSREKQQLQVVNRLQDPNSPESKQLRALKARDKEVRAHEQAQMAAAGSQANSSPRLVYQRGPDGRQYAVGGEVQINFMPVESASEGSTEKAEILQKETHVPKNSSSQDQSTATDVENLKQQEPIHGESENSEEFEAMPDADPPQTNSPTSAANSAVLQAKIEQTGATTEVQTTSNNTQLDVFA